MVVNASTIRGLDEALAELERAIESIQDSGTKRQLQKKYQRLSEVRKNLSGNSCPPPIMGKILFLIGLLSLTLVIFLSLFTRKH